MKKQVDKIYRRAKKLWMAILFGVMTIGSAGGAGNPAKVCAAQQEFVVSEHWMPAAVIHDGGEKDAVTKRGAVFATRYDARDYGWVTPVKDQGKNESCWAFSSISAIETNLIKNGRADAAIDLSENQLAYFYYNRQPDTLGYTVGDYNQSMKGDYLGTGGSLQGTGLALATWAGVTTEARSPYLTIPDLSLCYTADYSVKNVYLYNYDVSNLGTSIETIKQAVLDHGAVACGIYWSNMCYNPANSSYNCPLSGGNHAITIVGWDDTYSKEKFNFKPSSDGAWIVKNSYGTEFGDDGYCYVSYEDRTLTEFIAFETVTAAEQYDNNYQHDGTANPAYSYNKGAWYANVFQAKGANGYNEELKAVGVYTLTTNCSYELQVYTGLTDKGKPTSGTKVFSSTVKGVLPDAGFQTIVLPKNVSLTAGESFAVVVSLKDSYGQNAYIGVDSTYQNDWITFIANVGEKQSFVKVDNKWYDFGIEAKGNFRIKAYTDVTTVQPNFKLSDSKAGISKGDSYKLSLVKPGNVYRNVTWKSSNKKVATVSASGKVKGKGYGTTTISATFMGGAKKKTLKCKVTVGPAKVKQWKAKAGKKLKLQWKKSNGANGYEVFYASSKEGTYKKLATIAKGSATSYTKKMKKGTYYIKMRPYKLSGSKKLYGGFSKVKAVTIQ